MTDPATPAAPLDPTHNPPHQPPKNAANPAPDPDREPDPVPGPELGGESEPDPEPESYGESAPGPGGEVEPAPEPDREPEPGSYGEPAPEPDRGTGPADVAAGEEVVAGELDVLAAALESDDGAEPRRHWLRYPGVLGALAIIGVVMLIPCGAGTLFVTGGFADHGRYAAVPDACRQLTTGRVRAEFGDGLVRFAHSTDGDSSSCSYQGSAAAGPSLQIRLALTRYGTKGPVSAPQVAHAGLQGDLAGVDKRDRSTLRGVADEAVRVRTGTGVTVYARSSNLVLELDATGDDADLPAHTVAAATHLAAEL